MFAPISRESSLILNNLLLTTSAAVVLLGTLYPLILDALGGGKVSVGAPFFNATFIPLMVPAMLAAVVGAMLTWKRADLGAVLSRLKVALLSAVIVTLSTAWVSGGLSDIIAAVGLGISAWLIIGSATELAERIYLFRSPFSKSLRRSTDLPRSFWGMIIAHSALGIMVAGITASSAWKVEKIQLMGLGDTVNVAGYEVKFKGTQLINGPNYIAERGIFVVSKSGKSLMSLMPEKRQYPAERGQTTEAGIKTMFMGDLYVVLGEKSTAASRSSDKWSTRIYYNPLVAWIWGGAILLAFGGIISLTDRRHRTGTPTTAKKFKLRQGPAAGSKGG